MIALVVESPALARTLGGLLGHEVLVRATFGSVAALAPGTRADIAAPPQEKLLPGKAHLISGLRRLSRKTRILLATDPDREGEAAAFVLAEALGLATPGAGPPFPACRVFLRGLSREAVVAAIAEPLPLRRGLRHASLLRRLVDADIARSLSLAAPGSRVGRVQAAALHLLAGPARAGFEVEVVLPRRGRAHVTDAAPSRMAAVLGKADAESLALSLSGATARVGSIHEEEVTLRPAPPFTTATLLEEAAARGIGAGAAARILHRLHQGHPIDGIFTSLVSYPRTLEAVLAPELASAAARAAGAASPRWSGAAASHGAIVPTDLSLDPRTIPGLRRDERRVLTAIHERLLRSQEADATASVRTCILEVAGGPTGGAVRLAGADLRLSPGEAITLGKAHVVPARGEPALLAALASSSVGRPATLGAVVDSLRTRGLVEGAGRALSLSSRGEEVVRALSARAPELCSTDLTVALESALASVEEGDPPWPEALQRTFVAVRRRVGRSHPRTPDLGGILAGIEWSVP